MRHAPLCSEYIEALGHNIQIYVLASPVDIVLCWVCRATAAAATTTNSSHSIQVNFIFIRIDIGEAAERNSTTDSSTYHLSAATAAASAATAAAVYVIHSHKFNGDRLQFTSHKFYVRVRTID